MNTAGGGLVKAQSPRCKVRRGECLIWQWISRPGEEAAAMELIGQVKDR